MNWSVNGKLCVKPKRKQTQHHRPQRASPVTSQAETPTGGCTLPRRRDQQHMTGSHRRLRRGEVGTGAAAVPLVGQRLADGLEFGLLPRIGR